MRKKKYKTTHEENLHRLARIEGQVRGIRRMVDDGVYCIDIVNQIDAARSALNSLRLQVLHKHMDHCVVDALRDGAQSDAQQKVDELMAVVKRSCR